MAKKTSEILDSFYYDGRKKLWRKENIVHTPISFPSPAVVEYWVEKWENTKGYPEQERALDKLFKQLLVHNHDLNDILIKVCTLNDFYSTNIYNVLDVATTILDMDLDVAIFADDVCPQAVDRLNEEFFKRTGKHIYSFATKYFSHHRPDLYPIYDSYVDKLLRYYRDEYHFASFSDKDIMNYCGFYIVVSEFKDFFWLTMFTAKEIDKFLWQAGKYHFPKYISNKIPLE